MSRDQKPQHIQQKLGLFQTLRWRDHDITQYKTFNLGLRFSEFSHSAMGTGTPCVQRHVFDRHCMFGPLFVVAVLQLLRRFFFA